MQERLKTDIMNKTVSFSCLLFVSVFLFSCKSTKEISQNNPPFKLLEASYDESIQKNGNTSITLYIKIDDAKIALDSVYFRNQKSILKKTQGFSTEIYTAQFLIKNSKSDLYLHADSKKEFGNQVPDVSRRIPFELKFNEVVVGYSYKEEQLYYKFEVAKRINFGL